jgi:hypothetical protein
VCFAVIEHVGSLEKQQAFINELCRVGRSCFITTPNRWYPIEFHTVIPFIHWLPPTYFRAVLTSFGKDFYAKEENLNLLTRKELSGMFPKGSRTFEAHHWLLGMTSNLIFYVK